MITIACPWSRAFVVAPAVRRNPVSLYQRRVKSFAGRLTVTIAIRQLHCATLLYDAQSKPTSASDSDPSTNDAQDSVEATNNKLLHQVLEKVGKRRKTPKKLSELKGTMAQYTKMATLLSSEFDQPPQVTVADVDRFNPLGQSHSTSLRTRMLFEGQWKNAVDSLSQAFVADQLRAYIANHSKHLSPRTREKSLGKCAKAKLIDIIMREIWKLKRSKDEMDRAITKRKTTMAPTSKTLTIDRALYTLLGFKNTLLQVGLKTVTEIQPMAQDQLLQLTPIIGDESPAPVQLTIAGTQQNVGVATRALQAIRDGISETICIIDPAAGFTATDPTLRQLLIQVCQACSVIVRVKAESGLTLMFSSLGQRDAMAAKRMLLAFVDQVINRQVVIGLHEPFDAGTTLNLVPVPTLFDASPLHQALSLARLAQIDQRPVETDTPLPLSWEHLVCYPVTALTNICTPYALLPSGASPSGQLFTQLLDGWRAQLVHYRQDYPEAQLEVTLSLGQVGFSDLGASSHRATLRPFNNPTIAVDRSTLVLDQPSPLTPQLGTFQCHTYPVTSVIQLKPTTDQHAYLAARWITASPTLGDPSSLVPNTVEVFIESSPDDMSTMALKACHHVLDNDSTHLLLPQHTFDLTITTKYYVPISLTKATSKTLDTGYHPAYQALYTTFHALASKIGMSSDRSSGAIPTSIPFASEMPLVLASETAQDPTEPRATYFLRSLAWVTRQTHTDADGLRFHHEHQRDLISNAGQDTLILVPPSEVLLDSEAPDRAQSYWQKQVAKALQLIS